MHEKRRSPNNTVIRNLFQKPKGSSKENVSVVKTISNKVKIKTRESLPMKLRVLPRSFWQQPNRTTFASPGLICSILPPIMKEDNLDSETIYTTEDFKQPEFVSDANTDLLFSLFEIVEEDQKQRRFCRARGRGRPRKLKRSKPTVIRDEDPYLASNAAEDLLPFLPVRNCVDNVKISNQQVVTMLTSESIEPGNDYSHILSQLVVQL